MLESPHHQSILSGGGIVPSVGTPLFGRNSGGNRCSFQPRTRHIHSRKTYHSEIFCSACDTPHGLFYLSCIYRRFKPTTNKYTELQILSFRKNDPGSKTAGAPMYTRITIHHIRAGAVACYPPCSRPLDLGIAVPR